MEENLDDFFDVNPFLAEIYSNGSSKPETLDASKQVKISSMSWNSCHDRETISTNPSSSAAASAPRLISFENSNADTDYNSNVLEMTKDYYSLTPQIINFSTLAEDDSGNQQYHDAANGKSHKRVCTGTRTPSQAQDHLMAERKRRENLSQLFINLSKVVPGLKKLDKASLLEDGINHLKALQERVRVLEEEEINRCSIDTSKDNSSLHKESSIANSGITGESAAPEIQARLSDKHVLIKIFCKKQMGLMSRIPCEMEKINLSVVDMRMMPFGGAALDVTVLAEMRSEFGGTVKDIVDYLQASCFLESPRQI